MEELTSVDTVLEVKCFGYSFPVIVKEESSLQGAKEPEMGEGAFGGSYTRGEVMQGGGLFLHLGKGKESLVAGFADRAVRRRRGRRLTEVG